MLSPFLPQYSPQALIGTSPAWFGQPSAYGFNGSLGYQPVPAGLAQPPYVGYAGIPHPSQQIILLLGQLAQQISVQGGVSQQIAAALNQLAHQLVSYQLLAQGQPLVGAAQAFGFGAPFIGAPVGQYLTPGLFAGAQGASRAELEAARQEALIGPLRNVFGVSDKVLTMTLSTLLIGARNQRPIWFETGKAMIAVDTLVHNFLHRTGILQSCGIPHTYGAACYSRGGCAEIIRAVSNRIDARTLNRAFPQTFPRFVQNAIWRFCAADGQNLCNGNRIDDRQACQISYCQLYQKCRRMPLKR